MLRFCGQQLVSLDIEINLQFLNLSQINFVVANVYFGHDFTIVIAYLSVNLS